MRAAIWRIGLTAAVMGLVAGAEGQARAAQIITFDTSSGFAAGTLNGTLNQSLAVDGFDFTPQNGYACFITIVGPSGLINNGTPDLFAANHTTLTMTGATPFTLNAFDLAGSWADPSLFFEWASSVTVTGKLAGGGTVGTTVGLPSTATFETVALPPGFTNLTSVVFSPNVDAGGGTYNYEFSLDNVVINGGISAAPEPATLAPAGLAALAGVGYAWRKRRRVRAAG